MNWQVRLKILVLEACLLIYLVLALPSARQCLHYQNNSAIQARCQENKNHQLEYMPSEKAIHYNFNYSLNYKKDGIPHPYFPLCPFDTHRDGRYCKDIVIPNRNRVFMIKRLFSAFIDFTNDFNLKWWVAHGALIGWFYNENLLPWDTDVDVKILYYDLITNYIKFDKFLYGERYLLEINPHYDYRDFQEEEFIDARFIDTTNGLYVDIMGMVYDENKKHLYCKSPRYYTADDLFPLRNYSFMGLDNVWLPNNPIRMMEKDYGKACMEMKKWARPRTISGQTYDIEFYKWNEAKQVFVADDDPPSWRSVFREKKRLKKVIPESKQG